MVVGDGGSMAAVSLYGSFTAESLVEISSAVADNTGILSIDMTGAESVENGSSVTTGNPNTVIFVPGGVTLGNSCNVIAGGACANLVIADGFAFAIADRRRMSYVQNLRRYCVCRAAWTATAVRLRQGKTSSISTKRRSRVIPSTAPRSCGRC